MCDRWNCDDCELCQIPFRIVCDIHSLNDEEYANEYVETMSATYRNYKIWDYAWGIYEESDSISENKKNRASQKILKDWFDKSVHVMQKNLLSGINDIILTSTKEKVTPVTYVTLKLRIVPLKD